MSVAQAVFWVFAAITAVGTIGVVTVQNVVHAALALVATLMGTAGIFLLFGAEFVGLVQVLIYVGAVVVLFLFGIMLTAPRTGVKVLDNSQRLLALVASLGVFGVLALSMVNGLRGERLELSVSFPTRELGTALFTTWVLPFEAISFLLLAALIGAIVLARRD